MPGHQSILTFTPMANLELESMHIFGLLVAGASGMNPRKQVENMHWQAD